MSTPVIDYSKRDFQAIKNQIIGFIQDYFPDSFNDFYEDSSSIMLMEIQAFIGDLLAYNLDAKVNDMFVETTRYRPNICRQGTVVGYRANGPTPARVTLTGTIASTQLGNVTLNAGTAIPIQKQGVSYTYTLIEDLVINEGSLTGTAEAVEGAFTTETFTSDGERWQKFVIQSTMASYEELEVKVNGTLWTESNYFMFAESGDEVYRAWINPDGYLRITFGNGTLGKIPPNTATITIKYLVPSGTLGNVTQGFISHSAESDTHAGVYVTLTNSERSSGAADEQSLESIKNALPGHTRSVGRLYSKPDYEDLLGAYPSVEKIKVYDRSDLCVDSVFVRPFRVLVYLTFEDGEPASSAFLETIQSWTDDRKNPGTDVVVRNAEQVTYNISGTIDLMAGAYRAGVVKLAEAALKSLFDDADIGKAISSSQIVSAIQNLTDVSSVTLTSTIPTVGKHQIARLGTVTLT